MWDVQSNAAPVFHDVGFGISAVPYSAHTHSVTGVQVMEFEVARRSEEGGMWDVQSNAAPVFHDVGLGISAVPCSAHTHSVTDVRVMEFEVARIKVRRRECRTSNQMPRRSSMTWVLASMALCAHSLSYWLASHGVRSSQTVRRRRNVGRPMECRVCLP